MLCSSFILLPTEWKTTAVLEIKFNVPFVSGMNLYSRLGSSVTHGRGSAVLVMQKITGTTLHAEIVIFQAGKMKILNTDSSFLNIYLHTSSIFSDGSMYSILVVVWHCWVSGMQLNSLPLNNFFSCFQYVLIFWNLKLLGTCFHFYKNLSLRCSQNGLKI